MMKVHSQTSEAEKVYKEANAALAFYVLAYEKGEPF